MKIKNNKFPIILLLVFLTLITIISSNLFIYSSEQIIDSQANIENDSSMLKLSLIEDWNVTWDKGDNEYGQSVAIDETTGDIYVVGYNGSVDYDIILIKYNTNGKQQWNITWDGGVYEYGYDVAVDSLGYIYVAAANGTSYPNFDVLLLKFNSNGDLEWKSSYDSGLYDGAWALTLDSQNMIYVVGQTFTTSNSILLLKYNSSGHLQWSSAHDKPGYQAGRDIVLDSSNNIYVSGVNQPVGLENDLLLVKFDNSGDYLWNRTWGGSDPDEAWGIALDSKENVYASGYTQSYSAMQNDYIVVKYDSDGNWHWNRTWGTIASDKALGIAVDSADNIYLGGYALGLNISILKYDSKGNLLWHKTWERSPTYQHFCFDLIIDSSDKIYITGNYGIGPFYDLYLIKLSIESPGGFYLTSIPLYVNTDGNFTLSWSSSPRARNYSVYQYSSYITEINDTLIILANETDALSLPLSDYSDGLYYFRTVAFNDFGNSTSNCIYLFVALEEPAEPAITGYNLLIFTLTIGIISIILIKKRLNIKK